MAWVDYEKAFDKVWRQALFYKMLKQGVSAKIVDIVRKIYADIKSKVQVNGEFSRAFLSYSGVRQGESLSPLLFSIYLNDLEEFMINRGCEQLEVDGEGEIMLKLMLILYADDTAIVANSAYQLQKSLEVLGDYCEKWRLSINVAKTKITIFERTRSKTNRRFTYNDKDIEIVPEFCYLGTILSFNGAVKAAVDKQVSQGEKAMFSLIKKARKLGLPIDLQLDLFHKLITPILTYNCEVWGFNEKEVEKMISS